MQEPTRCAVCRLLPALTPRDRVALTAALDGPIEARGHRRIELDLRAEGFAVSFDSIARHRRNHGAR